MTKLRPTLALCAIVMAAMFALAPLGIANAAQVENPFKNLKVTGTAANGATFKGNFDIKEFKDVDGALHAVGTLKGQLTDGKSKNKVEKEVSWPVSAAAVDGTSLFGAAAAAPSMGLMQIGSGACTILDLTLGPLDLDLLGLEIDLSRIDLTITADPTGGLLGQLLSGLLCDLLDFLGNIGQLANILNQIIDLFNRF